MSNSKRKVRSLTLRGKRYSFEKSGNLPKTDRGYCTDPNDTQRKITIHKCLVDQEELEVLIHEMLHACFWDVDEEVIGTVGDDISKALWRMGYRKDKPKNE